MGTTPPDDRALSDDARWRFGLFSGLLALALLLHQLWWNGFEVWGVHGVVVALALAVLVRPTSVALVLGLLAAEVVAVARDMPGVGSHTLLVGVCGASVLAYATWGAVRARRLPEAGALFDGVAPFLRLSLLVLYAAAALAKMNSQFFDPLVSCAAALAPRIAWFDPGLLDGAWLARPAILGTVGIEAALPVLLAVRRTRAAALALGVAFHLVLALAGNVPFSSLVLALYVAFLPAGAMARAREAIARRAPRLAVAERGRRRVRGVAVVALLGGWALGAAVEAADPATVREAIGTATRLAVVVVALAAAAGALAVRRTSAWPPGPPGRGLRPGHPVLAAGVAVLVANALTPYLGLKTESSFTMFSNLQTEGGAWNHAFLPEAIRVFGQQDRLVTVIASDDPSLVRRTRNGTRIVRFELERHLRLHPGVHATIAPGRTLAGGDTTPPPLAGLVDRVAKFRDVRPLPRRGC